MSISGFLEDASVAEVLQFIHFGRRTGTLFVACEQERASIGFDAGRIVSAHRSGAKRIGEYLIERHAISREDLLHALRQQAVETPRRHVGKVLVDNGAVAPEMIEQVVARQIEETVQDLIGWPTGTFDFLPDNLNSLDAAAARSPELAVPVNLSTEAVALKALSFLDEEGREEVRSDHDQGAGRVAVSSSSPVPQLRVVSNDPVFIAQLTTALGGSTSVVRLDPKLLREHQVQGPPSVVAVDVRRGQGTVEDIRTLKGQDYRAPILALAPPGADTAAAYSAGALAVLPPVVGALAACYHSIQQSMLDFHPGVSLRREGDGNHGASHGSEAGQARSALAGPMVVDLMSIVSESADRALLFVVTDRQLSIVASFGFGVDGRPLAELTRNLKIRLDEPNVLTEAVANGSVQSFAFGASLPAPLVACLGPPRSGRSVVVAIQGRDQVFAVLYADNGQSEESIEQVDALDFAGEQLGLAIERELLGSARARGRSTIVNPLAPPVARGATAALADSSADDAGAEPEIQISKAI